MKLGNYTEIIANLSEVKQENGQTKLFFSFQKEIEFPIDAISKKKLEGFVGERVGVFNCNGDIKIRKIGRRYNDR